MPTKADTREPMQPLMFGYTRVSTDEQADRRNGLEAQRETIDSAGHAAQLDRGALRRRRRVRQGHRPEAAGSVATVGFWAR